MVDYRNYDVRSPGDTDSSGGGGGLLPKNSNIADVIMAYIRSQQKQEQEQQPQHTAPNFNAAPDQPGFLPQPGPSSSSAKGLLGSSKNGLIGINSKQGIDMEALMKIAAVATSFGLATPAVAATATPAVAGAAGAVGTGAGTAGAAAGGGGVMGMLGKMFGGGTGGAAEAGAGGQGLMGFLQSPKGQGMMQNFGTIFGGGSKTPTSPGMAPSPGKSPDRPLIPRTVNLFDMRQPQSMFQ